MKVLFWLVLIALVALMRIVSLGFAGNAPQRTSLASAGVISSV